MMATVPQVTQRRILLHKASKQSFGINIDDQVSILEYAFKNHRLFLTHTEVPPALESQGLGTELAPAALEYGRQNDSTNCDLPFCARLRRRSPGISVVCDHIGCGN